MEAKGVIHRYRLAALCVVAALAACSGRAPDAGTLAPIYVPPAEDVQVLSLKRGQTLGEVLGNSIKPNEWYAVLAAFQQQASPRSIRAGTEITLRRIADNGRLRGVDVQLSKDKTVRLIRDPADDWSSEIIRTPTVLDTLYAAGRIDNSLWESVVENPGLASMPVQDRGNVIDALDNVFQWQIDFAHQILDGDTYRFVFQESIRPDGSMQSGKILAAEIVNAGKPYYAIYFDPKGNGQGSYYDLDGRSVRRAFLRKPLAYRRISSRYSMHRWEPILHIWRPHLGVDYAAPEGTPVWATADGVVIFRGRDDGYGNLIELRHPKGWQTRYAHLEGFKRGLHVGSRVKQGEVIGYVGETGLATGPHLHYEMLQDGRHVNPLDVILPTGEPVPEKDRADWTREMTARLALLNSIPGAGPVRTLAAATSASSPASGPAEANGR